MTARRRELSCRARCTSPTSRVSPNNPRRKMNTLFGVHLFRARRLTRVRYNLSSPADDKRRNEGRRIAIAIECAAEIEILTGHGCPGEKPGIGRPVHEYKIVRHGLISRAANTFYIDNLFSMMLRRPSGPDRFTTGTMHVQHPSGPESEDSRTIRSESIARQARGQTGGAGNARFLLLRVSRRWVCSLTFHERIRRFKASRVAGRRHPLELQREPWTVAHDRPRRYFPAERVYLILLAVYVHVCH